MLGSALGGELEMDYLMHDLWNEPWIHTCSFSYTQQESNKTNEKSNSIRYILCTAK